MLDLKTLLRRRPPHPQPLPPRGRGADAGTRSVPSLLGGEGWIGGPTTATTPASKALQHTTGRTRRSPLHRPLRPGRYGADRPGSPGVILAPRHPVSIVSVMARRGKAASLSQAMADHFGLACPAPGHSAMSLDLALHWCGFEQWYAVGDGPADGALHEEMRDRLAGLAAVSDQSHGRVIVRLAGPHVRDVLAKGTPVDLHPRSFGPGRCAVTQMAHVGVHLAQTGPEAFELSLFRGFAESFWEWLTEMSDEFGYEVR